MNKDDDDGVAHRNRDLPYFNDEGVDHYSPIQRAVAWLKLHHPDLCDFECLMLIRAHQEEMP